MLIVFDRMFGTYVEETEPVDYGITQQIRSYNFLALTLHEFVGVRRDVLAPGPIGQRLRHLWMPSGRCGRGSGRFIRGVSSGRARTKAPRPNAVCNRSHAPDRSFKR